MRSVRAAIDARLRAGRDGAPRSPAARAAGLDQPDRFRRDRCLRHLGGVPAAAGHGADEQGEGTRGEERAAAGVRLPLAPRRGGGHGTLGRATRGASSNASFQTPAVDS